MFRKTVKLAKNDIGFRVLTLCLFLMIETTFFISIILYHSAQSMKMDTMKQIGATLHVGPNPAYAESLLEQQIEQEISINDTAVYPVLTSKIMQEILALPHVLGIEGGANSNTNFQAIPVSFQNCKVHTGVDPEGQENLSGIYKTQETLQTLGEAVSILGCMRVELFDYFRRNLSTLILGSFPAASNPGACISEELAEINGLSVGDMLTIRPFTEIFAEDGEDQVETDMVFADEETQIKITGIYSTKLYFRITENNTDSVAIYSASPYNLIFTDYETAAKANGTPADIRFFDIYVDSPEHLDSVMQEVEKLDVDWQKLSLENQTDSFYQEYAGQMTKLLQITDMMLLLSLFGGTLLFCFVFAYAASSLSQDFGVLICLGEKKRTIFLEQGMVLLLTGFVVFPFALGVAYVTADLLKIPLLPELIPADSIHLISAMEMGENEFVPLLKIALKSEDVIFGALFGLFLNLVGMGVLAVFLVRQDLHGLFAARE